MRAVIITVLLSSLAFTACSSRRGEPPTDNDPMGYYPPDGGGYYPENESYYGDESYYGGSQSAIAGGTAAIFGQDGQFLGLLSPNRADQNSVCNEYGPYGNMGSWSSVRNAYSQYGSPNNYAMMSAYNPYATTPPVVCYFDGANCVQVLDYFTKNQAKQPALDPDAIINSLCR